MIHGNRLGQRLRAIRLAGFGGEPVTQGVVASALHRSVPLVSSWEKGKALPPEESLHVYARFFATSRSYAGGRAHLLPLEDLLDEERQRFEQLSRELIQLRAAAGPGAPPVPQRADEVTTRTPWEGMWHFGDRAPITLVCARRPVEPATGPESPDYVELAAYDDLDALLELHGHVCAANPGVTVHHRLADELDHSDLTNHLVLLGGVGAERTTGRIVESLKLPVVSDPQLPAFRVAGRSGRSSIFRSTLEAAEPHPRLTEDVALFCRAPNPFNRKRSVTICDGNYGRGTYAAVRTLTDPRFRDRNRAYLEQRYGPDDTYGVLARVAIVAGEVITPDWTQAGTVLHEWANTA